MTGRHILDGDVAVLEHGKTPCHGNIVAAFVDGKSTLKSFIRHNGKTFLRAAHPDFPQLIPAEDLMIQGVVVALIRQRV